METFIRLSGKMTAVILSLILGFGVMSCSKDDDNEDFGDLNGYEQALVGSWESIDDDEEIFYLDLNSDRTGKWVGTYQGKVEGTETYIHWEASKNKLTIISKKGEVESWAYVLNGKKLQLGEITYKKK